MIELKNVSKFYNDNKIVTVGLRNVSLKLNKGEFVAITGDSGSGKSTLLNVISSIDSYDDGEILFYGNETFYFNQNDSDIFRKNNVSFIFQKYNIVDSYTVLENVMLPLIIKGKSEEEAKREALEIIARVGLEARADHRGTKLSGGEKQRCVIARALATDAPILACDEPTGNLDSKTSKEIIDLIKEVSGDKLVLVVTHDYESIKDVCTRKIKMSDGEIVEDITFSEGIEEADHKLDLDDSKPRGKTLLRLASLNIFSTPKKTVFSTMVFTFVSCVFLLLSLLMVKTAYDENYTYNNNYGIISEDRAIIFDSNHASLDMERLKSALRNTEYYENSFYEECGTYINLGDYARAHVAVTFNAPEYELIAGKDPTAPDEFLLVMPDYYYTHSYGAAVDSVIDLVVEATFAHNVPIGTLVGVAISEDVNGSNLVAGGYNEKIANQMINNYVELTYSVDDLKGVELPIIYDPDIEKCYIAMPTELKDRVTLTFNLESIYSVSYDVDVVYTDDVEEPVFYVNSDYLNGKIAPKFDGIKEISVYTDNTLSLQKSVQALGYSVTVPSRMDHSDGLSLIVLYMLSSLILMALSIMFYISFAVLQRIYLTKTKDYSIFRTLGLVSEDLKRVLIIEIIALTLASIIFGGILANLIIAVTKVELHRYVSVGLIAVYVVTMIIFSLATANRLNNKIFKNSVYQSLREGGE